MSDVQVPSESERKAFVAQVAEFRSGLPVTEQWMLDALVGAAVAGRAPEDVAPYWFGGSQNDATDILAPGLTFPVWSPTVADDPAPGPFD